MSRFLNGRVVLALFHRDGERKPMHVSGSALCKLQTAGQEFFPLSGSVFSVFALCYSVGLSWIFPQEPDSHLSASPPCVLTHPASLDDLLYWEVCGWEPIHLIHLAKAGTVYLPVLERTSIRSCWEGWGNQESSNGRGFSIKAEGVRVGGGHLWVWQARSGWHHQGPYELDHYTPQRGWGQDPGHDRGAVCSIKGRKERRGHTIEQSVLITSLRGSHKTWCICKLIQRIWLLQDLIFIRRSRGARGLDATLFDLCPLVYQWEVLLLSNWSHLYKQASLELMQSLHCLSSCYSVAWVNKWNPFAPWEIRFKSER